MIAAIAGLAFFALVGTIVLAARRQRALEQTWAPPPEYVPAMRAAPTGSTDVTALRIGIDGRASKFVRTELEAIEKTYADDSAATRARKLREVSVMLRRVRDSWIYGGADNEPMRPREQAFTVFGKHVDAARTRLSVTGASVGSVTSSVGAATGALGSVASSVGSAAGALGSAVRSVGSAASSVGSAASSVGSPAGPPVTLILVSVIVVARGELMTVTERATAEDLRRALESAAHRAPDEILALEVVWTPDVLSFDVDAVYSRGELHRLDGGTDGKLFCQFCNGPFPAELVSCPHCGGRAPGR